MATITASMFMALDGVVQARQLGGQALPAGLIVPDSGL